MQTVNIYSLYDSKTDIYSIPLTFNEDEMKAYFSMLVNSFDDFPEADHPTDFVVVQVGVFDLTLGLLSSISPNKIIGPLSQFLVSRETQEKKNES